MPLSDEEDQSRCKTQENHHHLHCHGSTCPWTVLVSEYNKKKYRVSTANNSTQVESEI